MRHAVRSATPISAPSSSKRRRSRSAVAAGLSVNLPPGDRFDASAVESEQQSLAALAGVSVPLSQRPFSRANLRVRRSSNQGIMVKGVRSSASFCAMLGVWMSSGSAAVWISWQMKSSDSRYGPPEWSNAAKSSPWAASGWKATASRWNLSYWASPPECGGQPQAFRCSPTSPWRPAMASPRRPL